MHTYLNKAKIVHRFNPVDKGDYNKFRNERSVQNLLSFFRIEFLLRKYIFITSTNLPTGLNDNLGQNKKASKQTNL